MEINFKGKRAIVTGAGSGIGRDIAKSLYEAGATTYGVSLLQSELDSLQTECPDIIPICQDISDWKATQEAIENIGPVDILVNCAGIFSSATLMTLTENDYDKAYGVLVKGLLCISQVIAKNMVEHKIKGRIINISSIAGAKATPFIVYSSAKGAVQQITRCMAVELGPHQIQVNAIQPTLVRATSMGQGFVRTVGGTTARLERTPLKRLAEIGDITNSVLYLASDVADMINGAILPVDGGVLCT